MAIALSGIELHNFAIALFLPGVGRNFLFTGSTTLSLTTYAPEERNQAQAALNFLLFAVMAISSLSCGALVTTRGWTYLNFGALPLLLLVAACAGASGGGSGSGSVMRPVWGRAPASTGN